MSARRGELSYEAARFRRHLIDALWDDAMFGYVDQDRFIGSCPVCGTAVAVRFHGTAATATLNCHGGCSEAEIADRLGLVVRL
jgi:hypothetical protein